MGGVEKLWELDNDLGKGNKTSKSGMKQGHRGGLAIWQ